MTAGTPIIALSAEISNGAKWVQLMEAGEFMARDGRGPFKAGHGAALAAIIKESLRIAGRTELVIDYDHQSVFGARDGVGGTAKAAGWIKELEARDDGIWGRVEWTAAAEAAIKAGEYRYLSPVLLHAKGTGAVTAIRMAALTNTPALDLAQVAANTLFEDTTALASAEAPIMTDTPRSKLAVLLGLAGEADDAALTARVADILSQAKAAGVLDQAVKDAGGTALSTPNAAEYVPLSLFTKTVEELQKLRQGTTEENAKRVVDQHIRDGKVMPFMREWAISLCTSNMPAFEAFAAQVGPAATAMLTPQFGARDRSRPETERKSSLTESELAVCAQMGVSAEAFAATRKAQRDALDTL